jgi:soluble lytic murein transglycosylase-like protein
MPSTARDLGVRDPFDPKENIHGGVAYLSYCLRRFEDVKLALAAYNAGPGIVSKLKCVPPYEETRNFVKKVLRHRDHYDAIL